MYSLVDQPVMHVLLATRQRVYSSQAYSHRHTERSNLLRSRVYLFINFTALIHFSLLLITFLDTLHSLRSVGITSYSSVNLYRTTRLSRGFSLYQKDRTAISCPIFFGGAKRIRTAGLLGANEALYQLSHNPLSVFII